MRNKMAQKKDDGLWMCLNNFGGKWKIRHDSYRVNTYIRDEVETKKWFADRLCTRPKEFGFIEREEYLAASTFREETKQSRKA